MHLLKNSLYRIHRLPGDEEQIHGIRWTPLPDASEPPTMRQASSERIVKSGWIVCQHLLSAAPHLLRDRKHHLRTFRQCYAGKELAGWLRTISPIIQLRPQAVGVWQVLLDEGVLIPVKQATDFHDSHFYRLGECPDHTPRAGQVDEELNEALSFLVMVGPDALLTMILRKPPRQRNEEELDVIFEELIHIKAVSHLSNTVKRQLASVLLFECHEQAGTVLFSQGDKGHSWYIIWKGSVNVVTNDKGLVTTLHEGDDFGQLALVNEAPRAATIILGEDNSQFLRVDKEDFNRILRDVEANTIHLKEHGSDVLVLEKNSAPSPTASQPAYKYTVMSGTPEKILEHLMESLPLDSGLSPSADSFLEDFLQTHQVFLPNYQLCRALLHHFHIEPSDGSREERAAYSLRRKRKVVHLVSQWVSLYGSQLREEKATATFLQELSLSVARDPRLLSALKEQIPERKKAKNSTENYSNRTSQAQLRNNLPWFPDLELSRNSQQIRAQDKIVYQVYRADHTLSRLLLPLNSSVHEVLTSLQGGEAHNLLLIQINSTGERVELNPGTRCFSSSLRLNERLYVCPQGQQLSLVPHPDQLWASAGSLATLELLNSKSLASQLTQHHWELFTSVHEVELIYYTFGKQNFPGGTTANFELCLNHFNLVQYWVVTELCLCQELSKRIQLLKKFIKLAAHCKEQRNLNSFFAVVFGLSNGAVSRLSRTWEGLNNKTRRVYQGFERLMDPSRNHRAYRMVVSKLTLPFLPFLPLLVKDLTFIQEGNKTYVDNLVNFEKMRMISRTVKLFRQCRNHFQLTAQKMEPEILSAQNSSSCDAPVSASPQPVRLYVRSLKAIDNEQILIQLSRQLEP